MKNVLSQNAFWIINKQLAKEVGLDAALLLSDLITKFEYFNENNQVDDNGWFFNTSENIEQDTTLSYFKQKAAIKVLIEYEFLETKLVGIPAKLHFKILQNKISSFLNTCIEKTQNVYNKNTINNNNKIIIAPDKKNQDSSFLNFKKEFLKKYSEISGSEYYFTAQDAAKIKSLIIKIKHAYSVHGNKSPTDNQLLNGFGHILERALSDKWIKDNFSLSIIDSQFNKLKIKTNETPAEKNREMFTSLVNKLYSKEY